MAGNLGEQLKEIFRFLIDGDVKKLVLVSEPWGGKTMDRKEVEKSAIWGRKLDLTLWALISKHEVWSYWSLLGYCEPISVPPVLKEWEAKQEIRGVN